MEKFYTFAQFHKLIHNTFQVLYVLKKIYIKQIEIIPQNL